MNYTPAAVEGFWVQAGGTAFAATIAAAVVLAESGGTSTAVSPTADYGLWQIHLPLHLGTGGITWTNWNTPVVNARAAVSISTRGANWGPWCTCWATSSDCGSGRLLSPQPGSPAYHYLTIITGHVSPVATTTAASTTGGSPPPTDVAEFTAWRQWIANNYVPMYETIANIANAYNQI